MPNPIVHFEIPADDVQRATKFYEQALGWKISDPWNMDYWLVETKDGDTGINGGLMPRRNPGQPFMNYIQVDSIDDAMAKVEAAGGTVALPKTEIGPGWGFIAAFKEPKETSSASTSPQRNPPEATAPLLPSGAKSGRISRTSSAITEYRESARRAEQPIARHGSAGYDGVLNYRVPEGRHTSHRRPVRPL